MIKNFPLHSDFPFDFQYLKLFLTSDTNIALFFALVKHFLEIYQTFLAVSRRLFQEALTDLQAKTNNK